MNKYLLLTVMLANVSGLCAQPVSAPVVEQEEYYYDDAMQCVCLHVVNDEAKRKAVRLARIISGVLGMCTMATFRIPSEPCDGSLQGYVESLQPKVYSALNPFTFFNGIVNLHRGLTGREIKPEDTGKFKKLMAVLGVFSINPFAIINSAMILWDGMK